MFFFSPLCLVASSHCLLCYHVYYFAALCWFFCLVIFTEADFVAQPKTRYFSVNLRTGLHSSYFANRKISLSRLYHIHITYANMISELYERMYSYINIFFTEELKQNLRLVLLCITYCESHELWKLLTVLSTCHNWELLITYPHIPFIICTFIIFFFWGGGGEVLSFFFISCS